MNKKSIHFITYGNHTFAQAKVRILKEAEEFGEFETVTGYGPEDLPQEFIKKYNAILNLPRGGGYWIWRPIILKKKLNEMKDGEFLVYLDAGSKINPEGKKRFFEYIELLEKSDYGAVSFQMSGNNGPGGLEKENVWTTKEIFNYFDISVDSEHANTGQYLGGILVLRKNKHLLKIIDELIKVIEYNPLLFTDYYNRFNQYSFFKDNRHEQSIFSLLRKIHGSVVIDGDESWMQPLGKGESLKYPFWAIRSRT